MSWSSLEYDGDWKILHHFACKFYSPFLLSSRMKGDDKIEIWLTNDLLQHLNDCVLHVEIWDWIDSKMEKSFSEKIEISPNSSKNIFQFQFSQQNFQSKFFNFYIKKTKKEKEKENSKTKNLFEDFENEIVASNFHLVEPLCNVQLPNVKISYSIHLHSQTKKKVFSFFCENHLDPKKKDWKMDFKDQLSLLISCLEIHFSSDSLVPFVYWFSEVAGFARPLLPLHSAQKSEFNAFILFPNKIKKIELVPLCGSFFPNESLLSFLQSFQLLSVKNSYLNFIEEPNDSFF